MSNFKNTESAKVLESLEFRIKAALGSIEDIRYSLSEIVDELTEVSDLADKLKDIIDAEDE